VAEDGATWLSVAATSPRLAPPHERAGIVVRGRLVARLLAKPSPPLVVLAAPPGYGKTTVLTQWIHREPRPAAWISLDENDNDPLVLLAHLAAAFRAFDPGWGRVERAPAGRSQSRGQLTLPLHLAALHSVREAFVLVLDDLHLLREREAVDVVTATLRDLPAGSTLAVASRDIPPLPLARYRANGALVEMGTNDLALDSFEADGLLDGAGLHLLPADVRRLAERTEGWAAGLYLAALSIQASGSTEAIHAEFRGTDRFVTDYLRAELFSRISPADMAFLRATAVLDPVSGPLADHALETSGSAARLEALERSNLFVAPVGRERAWYRYHTLFREMLRAELGAHDPDMPGRILARAATWHLEHGDPQRALDILLATGDHDRAAAIFTALGLQSHWRGRFDTVVAWIRRFGPAIERYPVAAALAAWAAALVGDATEAGRLADVAGRSASPGDGVQASALGGLRASLLRDGLEVALADAERGIGGVPPGHDLTYPALLARALLLEIQGDHEGAERDRRELSEMPFSSAGAPARTVALAQRACRAADRRQWAAAEDLVRRAEALVAANGLDDYSTSTFAAVAAARVAIHRGDRRRAAEQLTQAQRLRVMLTHALPAFAVDARIEMGRAYLALGDTAGARTMVAEAEAIRALRPDLGTQLDRLEQLRRQATAAPLGRDGASTLTPAELRLLPYLATHLTFPEIGSRLGTSQNTVKTQARSIYAKLDVVTRGEAVDAARSIGLLEV
jgi:LuxR family transcriptional regulator, maltose regulon positive regulatory protein